MHKMGASSETFKFICDAPGGEISSLIEWNEKGSKSSQVLSWSWQHYHGEKIRCWWEHTKPSEPYYHHPSNGVAYPKELIVNIKKINPAAACLTLCFTLECYHFLQRALVGLLHEMILLLVQKQLTCGADVKLVKLINVEHANNYVIDDQARRSALFRHGFLESSSKAIRYSQGSTNDVVDTYVDVA